MQSFDFNPRSREGSDGLVVKEILTDEISIRAPARGATMSRCTVRKDIDISIRAPARGATRISKDSVTRMRNFNPRSREGSDVLLSASRSSTRYFNPRSREGSDIRQAMN